MFCEQDEHIAIWKKACDAYPHGDPYVLDLFVWAYLNKREEYDALIEKHKASPDRVNMVQIMEDSVMKDLLASESVNED